MEISYKLEHFEGPLDLLLHLIEKNKVSIYDIPIVLITEQYLDFVSHMETEDLNVVSEFLVMAATLLDIKCRMLLPAPETERPTEEAAVPEADMADTMITAITARSAAMVRSEGSEALEATIRSLTRARAEIRMRARQRRTSICGLRQTISGAGTTARRSMS